MANYLIVGNSSGIGKELSQLLMTEGNAVFAINRRQSENATYAFVADVTVDELPAIEVPLDGIVYCPGSITLKPFRGLRPEDISNDLAVNVHGAVRVLKHYLPNLQKSNNASVVMFSTVAVSVGMPYHASVAMAKGAVEGLVRSLAAEWSPKIRVNCIAPSLTDTPLAAKLLETEAKRAAAAERHPLKNIGDARNIAEAAKFLLSDSAKFVTGQIWHLDGGLTSIRI